MIGDSYLKNLDIGDLVLYRGDLYLIVDFYVKYDRIWFTKLESMEPNTYIETPVLYLNKQ